MSDNEQPKDSEQLPASVIFMEMMRQAAAKSNRPAPRPKPEAPPLPTVEVPPILEIPELPVASEPEIPVLEVPVEATQVEVEAEAVPEPILDAEHVMENLVPETTGNDEPMAESPFVEVIEPPTHEVVPAVKPKTEAERLQDAALERERVRRVKRRQEKRRVKRVSILGGVLRSFLVVIPSAILIATILSWWTDPQFLRPEMRQNIIAALASQAFTPMPPTPTVEPNYMKRIGIVSGHRGPGQNGELYDPGAVCPDGLEENQINFQVASMVVIDLRGRGYSVDLLDEFDPRLNNYQADALVSIHANDCRDYGGATGYIVAKAAAKPEGGNDTLLAECIAKHYGSITALQRNFVLTRDMTEYHSFREIHPRTPAAILELGFMFEDREILTERPDLLSQGITNGIMCFLEPQFDMFVTPAASPPTVTP